MTTTAPSFKLITATNLYNFTQDGMHLVLIDCRSRSQFISGFVRKSYNFNLSSEDLSDVHNVYNYIDRVEENAQTDEEKYKTKKVRRIVLITENEEGIDTGAKEFLDRTSLSDRFDKKFMINTKFEEFKKKYPFLMISVPADESEKSFEEMQKYIIDNKEMDLLYANSSFPLEVIENKIFLGKDFHNNSKKLKDDLGIKFSVTINLSEENHNQIVREENNSNFLKININKDKIIDFDQLIDEINVIANEEKILFHGSDYDLCSAFIIAWIMRTLGLGINVASMKVFLVIGNTEVDRLIYNQLIHYTPGKITFKTI